MRLLHGFAAAAALLGGLTACGGGEEAFRNNMRTQGIANCQRGAAPEALAQVREIGTTVEALCTCAMDRYMRATSIEQLRQDRNNALPPALRNAMMQCMAEQVQRAGGGTAGTVPRVSGGPLPDPATAPALAEESLEPGEATTNAGGDKE